jgi:hypothetical protein
VKVSFYSLEIAFRPTNIELHFRPPIHFDRSQHGHYAFWSTSSYNSIGTAGQIRFANCIWSRLPELMPYLLPLLE